MSREQHIAIKQAELIAYKKYPLQSEILATPFQVILQRKEEEKQI